MLSSLAFRNPKTRPVPMLVVAVLALLFIAWLLLQPRLARRRRERLRSQPFPPEWRRILRRRVPYLRRLPADLQLQLKQHVHVFLAEKPFIGCGGLEISDEIRVTVAAQACLLILNRPTAYYPALRRILVYPSAFVVDRVRHGDAQGVYDGVVHEWQDVLSGEAWAEGQVVLAWDDTREDAAHPDDARNVVLHEFAHLLDMEKGHASGVPPMPRARVPGWAQVMRAEYEALRRAERRGEPTLIDPYGATDPTEFFAVATETFFEQPHALAQQHPALYAELSGYYSVDPAAW